MNKPVFFLGNLFFKFDLGRCDTCLFGLLKVKPTALDILIYNTSCIYRICNINKEY